jgi:hypothetical protein
MKSIIRRKGGQVPHVPLAVETTNIPPAARVGRPRTADPAPSTLRSRRHRARKVNGQDSVTIIMAIPRGAAIAFLKRRGVEVVDDRELGAALEPAIDFALRHLRW